MNQTRQYIEVYVRHGSQKLSIQCRPGKNLILDSLRLYNLKRHSPLQTSNFNSLRTVRII